MSRNSLKLFVAALTVALLVACSPSATDSGRPSVVASTSIVGDVVAQVAGDNVALTTLIEPGSDPHSFEPSPADLSTMEQADLIILNGFGLEESLVELVEGLDSPGKVLSASENVTALEGGHHHHGEDDHHDDHEEGEDHHEEGEDHHDEDADHDHEEGEDHDDDADHDHEEGEDHDEDGDHEHEEGEDHDHEEDGHEHEGFDPHVWMNPLNVVVWTQNIASALAEIDPDNAEEYEANAASYIAELQALDTWAQERISSISAEQRRLVTDHDALAYFADHYGFEVVGAVLPSYSTLGETSAADLAELQGAIQKFDVPAIFVGTTVNPDLAAQLAQDTGVQLVPIYTGALSAEDGPAASYLDFLRYNVDAIVDALQ